MKDVMNYDKKMFVTDDAVLEHMSTNLNDSRQHDYVGFFLKKNLAYLHGLFLHKCHS